MSTYEGLTPFYGDLHSHCGISYGHGSLADALANAREQLDFCSATGHAFWPDMPPPDPAYQHILDFHHEGFARLRQCWPEAVALAEQASCDGRFIAFPGYEMHSCSEGDHTIVYRECAGAILYSGGLAELRAHLRQRRAAGQDAILFPHHLGYPPGYRGVNWDCFTPEFTPVVEIVSMHGASEADESQRPYFHTMGPSSYPGTMQQGLARGLRFGVIGSTDHHSAHPGSHGHGRCGVWARALTRAALWEALLARRTYALTGDRIELRFSLNGQPMGATLAPSAQRCIEITAAAGGAIDYLDVIRNNRLLRRFSATDVARAEPSDPVRVKLCLEVGWGPRGKPQRWEAAFGVSAGRLLGVEPRFRGREVVSPLDSQEQAATFHDSHWERHDPRTVAWRTLTHGNPNTVTRATQSLCLELEAPLSAQVVTALNGRNIVVPLRRLLQGSQAAQLGKMGSAAYRLHRAVPANEYRWQFSLEDEPSGADRADCYYVRVRQQDDQWAWSSPIWVEPAGAHAGRSDLVPSAV
jgi:hypothetical protein